MNLIRFNFYEDELDNCPSYLHSALSELARPRSDGPKFLPLRSMLV